MILQVTALPLGNYEDVSARAIAALRQAEVIVCEDTRKIKHLLQTLSIDSEARFFSAPAGKDAEINWQQWCEQNKGKKVVLVSDAGTPIVNDPGRQLLLAAKKEGAQIEALPGPCAPILAYQWSGGFGLPIHFAGFVPKKQMAEFFKENMHGRTLIFFETKHQYRKSLSALVDLGLSDQKIFVAREMTKTHEELLSTTVGECSRLLEDRQGDQNGALGEMTFVLELPPAQVTGSASVEDLLQIRFTPPKEASKIIAKIGGGNAKDIYKRMVEWKA
ncbi:hypothetical protein GW915_07915 [bacterium]|nr:hypothetical protein [bacterium]